MNPKLELVGKAAVVGATVFAERIRKPRPLGRDDIPISGQHVTAEWLTDVVCQGVPGARVVSASIADSSSGTSERSALTLTYNAAGQAAGLPEDLFIKTTASFRQRMVIGGAGAIDGESHFYGGLRAKSTIEAPVGYWGRVDPRSWRSVTVMEDVAVTKGASFMTPTTGFARAQITDLVEGLARLHAPLWGDPGITALKTPADYLARANAFLDLRKRAEVGMRRAHEVYPPGLLGQSDRLYEATARSMDISSDEMPRTLLHGDCHAGQTYRTNTGAMGLGDWQAVLQGGWAFDFAYIVNSGCEPDDRRAWQDELLRAYLKMLHRCGGPTIAFDDAMKAYRQQAFWAYTAWAFTIGRAAYQPKMQPDETCRAIIHRTATAIDDLDAFRSVDL